MENLVFMVILYWTFYMFFSVLVITCQTPILKWIQFRLQEWNCMSCWIFLKETAGSTMMMLLLW